MDRRKFMSLGAVALAPIVPAAVVAAPGVMGVDLARPGSDVTAWRVYHEYRIVDGEVWRVLNNDDRPVFVRDRWIAPGETYEWPR